MKAEDYYKNIEAKWKNKFPSTKNIDEVWNFYKECGYANPQKTLNAILEKVNWHRNRVLDFGCDSGFMLEFICGQYPALSGVGIDINSGAVEEAKKNFPNLEFRVFDGLNFPFEDKSFDLIFASAVIKHIRYEDRERIYNEIKRVSDNVFFVEADSKTKEEVPHGSWTFYNSNFEKEFSDHFNPLKIVHEAGDLLGLYSCN